MNNKKLSICFIGTGKYLNFLPRYYETLMEYFIPECEKKFFVFTDGKINDIPENMKIYHIVDQPKPYDIEDNMYKSVGGLYRFSTIKMCFNDIKNFDWFLYIDSDYYCLENIITYDDFFNDEKDFFAVTHPTFDCRWKKFNGYIPHDRNQKSLACIFPEDEIDEIYIQGCLWGGKIPQIFKLIDELDTCTQKDLERGVIPKAHDESYLNKHRLLNVEKYNVLHPCFAKPGNISNSEFSYSAKMIHSPEDRNEVLK